MALVPDTPRTNSFTVTTAGSGPFLIGFRLFAADGVEVYTDGDLTTDYTVAATFADGFDDSATITFTDILAAGTVVQIDGATPTSRTQDYINSDPGLTDKLNIELARMAAALSEIEMKVGRSIRSLVALDPESTLTAEDVATLIGDIAAVAASTAAAEVWAIVAQAAAGSALASAALLGAWRGPHTPGATYALGDRSESSGSSYVCIVAHTAGTFATDLAAGKWEMFAQKGASGAGTGDVLASNNGSEFNAATFAANLALVRTSRLVSAGTGLTGGGDLTADRTLALTGMALALHSLASAGLVARTGAGTAEARTLTGTANQVTVTNGDGVAGDPTISIVTPSEAEAIAGTDNTKPTTTLRVAQQVAAMGITASDYEAFTSSGTWTKPSGIGADTPVRVEMWAGGGGGQNGSGGAGGGGGAYVCKTFRAGDLGATETVTVGAGGAVNNNGNNSSFGAHLTAYRGGRGNGDVGGGGGGAAGAGGTPTPGAFGGGTGGTAAAGGAATDINGGGGGGSGTAISGSFDGGDAYNGGGGGGGGTGTAPGGASVFGGDGGAGGSAGVAPGGGGGRNAAGARGEVRVWVG